MPIPPTDELLVKAEIKARLFEEAFVELAREFRKRDLRGFEASAHTIKRVLESFGVRGIVPPARALANTVEIENAQKEGKREAVEAFDIAVRKITGRLGVKS